MAVRYFANGLPFDLIFVRATEGEPADTNNPSGFLVELPGEDTNDSSDDVTTDLSTIYAALQPGDIPGGQIGFYSGSLDSNHSLNTFYKTAVNYNSIQYNPFSACTDFSLNYYYIVINDDFTYIPRQTIENVTLILIGAGGGGGSGLGYTGGGAGGNYVKADITLTQGYTYEVTIGKGGAGGAFTSGNFNGANGISGGSTTFSGFNGTTLVATYEATGGGGGGGSKRGDTGQGGTNNNANSAGYGGTYNTVVSNTSGTGSGWGYNGAEITFPTDEVSDSNNPVTQNVTFPFAPGGGAGGRNSSVVQKPMMPGGGGVGAYQQQLQYGCDTNTTFSEDTGGNGGLGSMGISTFNGNSYYFNGNKYSVGSGGGGGGNNSANNYSSGGAGGNGLAILVVPRDNIVPPDPLLPS